MLAFMATCAAYSLLPAAANVDLCCIKPSPIRKSHEALALVVAQEGLDHTRKA